MKLKLRKKCSYSSQEQINMKRIFTVKQRQATLLLQKVNKLKETINFLKCKNHDNNSKSWSSENASCGVCYNFEVIESLGERPILPRIGEVLSLVLTKKLPGRKDCLLECAYEIALKWINCNLYPVSLQTIKRRLEDLFKDYKGLKKFSNKTNTYWEKSLPFMAKQRELFDIIGKEFSKHFL